MGKIRRGNYIFLTWIGDHSPRNVHVYQKSKLVVKWDQENGQPMEGKASRRLIQLIEELEREGEL
jgi:hypothetical protein